MSDLSVKQQAELQCEPCVNAARQLFPQSTHARPAVTDTPVPYGGRLGHGRG